MKQLIVNADDFGLTQQVSQGILDAHRQGIVTSTTLMANGEAFEAAIAMSRRTTQLGVGVHLNLTNGIPVSPAFRIPTLVDARGLLHLTPGRLWKSIITKQVDLSDVETELRAQITKILRAGIFPTHLDGHKHVHVLPGVSEVVIRLAQDFGIPSVRCPLEGAPGPIRLLCSSRGAMSSILKQYLVGRGVSSFARRFKEKLAQGGLLCPEYFFGLSQTGFLDVRVLQDILSRLPEGTSELMCHPGYVDTDLVKTETRLVTQREVEMRALTALQVRRLVTLQGVQMVSYREPFGLAQAKEKAA